MTELKTQFIPIGQKQANALGRISKWKNTPPAVVVARDLEGNLIVVPASSRDRRRWDISKRGRISKHER